MKPRTLYKILSALFAFQPCSAVVLYNGLWADLDSAASDIAAAIKTGKINFDHPNLIDYTFGRHDLEHLKNSHNFDALTDVLTGPTALHEYIKRELEAAFEEDRHDQSKVPIILSMLKDGTICDTQADPVINYIKEIRKWFKIDLSESAISTIINDYLKESDLLKFNRIICLKQIARLLSRAEESEDLAESLNEIISDHIEHKDDIIQDLLDQKAKLRDETESQWIVTAMNAFKEQGELMDMITSDLNRIVSSNPPGKTDTNSPLDTLFTTFTPANRMNTSANIESYNSVLVHLKSWKWVYLIFSAFVAVTGIILLYLNDKSGDSEVDSIIKKDNLTEIKQNI